MGEITYILLTFTRRDLDQLFQQCKYPRLSQYKRYEALRGFLQYYAYGYLRLKDRVSPQELKQQQTRGMELVIDLILGKITRDIFILDVLRDSNLVNMLHRMIDYEAASAQPLKTKTKLKPLIKRRPQWRN